MTVESMHTRASRALRVESSTAWVIVVWFAAALYVVLVSAEALYNQSTFHTGFDSAIYDQRLWLLSNFENPFSTVVSRPFLADHFEPALVLLTPIYWLGWDLSGVYVVQSVGLALTAPALYALARTCGASAGLAAIPALLWLASPGVAAANLFDFRPATFLPVLLVLSVLFALQRRYLLLAVTTILALGLKEDVASIYFVLGILLAYRGQRRLGAILAGASTACFLLALVLMRSLGDQYEWQGERFAGERGDSIADALAWMVQHPLQTVGTVASESLPDLVVLVLSTGGLCLLAPSWMLLSVPTALYNALSAYEPQHELLFHYHLPILAGFFVAAAVGTGQLKIVGRVGRLALAAGLATFVAIALIGAVATHDVDGRLDRDERAAIHRALDLIPPDAAVAAAPNVLPHLSHRVELYSLPEPFIPLDWGSSLTADEFADRAARVQFAVFVGQTKPTEFPGEMAAVWNMLRREGFVPISRGPQVQILERRG